MEKTNPEVFLGVVIFICVMVFFLLLVFFIVGACLNYDRIIVFVLRKLQIYIFPTAIEISNSINRSPKLWEVTDKEVINKKANISIMTSYDADRLKVLIARVEWKPNKIERRIIWDASNSHRVRFLKNYIDQQLTAESTKGKGSKI